MNTPGSFEIAKLLKEKGFTQPRTIEEAKKLNLQFNWYNEDGVINARYKLDTIIHAPSISEVVMWLYEKYGIWIIVSHEISDLHQTEWFWIGVKNGEEIAYQYFGFNSPTEAYSQAIEYTLKNLI